MSEAFMHMGTLVRPHGLKGELCLDWYADFPLQPGGQFWLQAGQNPPRPVRAIGCRWHKGRPLLALEGVADRTAAEALRGQKLLMARSSLPPLDDDEVYVADLPGCTILLPDGSTLGQLDHVEYPAGQEIWAIQTKDGREILFPAQPQFIAGFDLTHRCVRIDPPEGLLDIYLS